MRNSIKNVKDFKKTYSLSEASNIYIDLSYILYTAELTLYRYNLFKIKVLTNMNDYFKDLANIFLKLSLYDKKQKNILNDNHVDAVCINNEKNTIHFYNSNINSEKICKTLGIFSILIRNKGNFFDVCIFIDNKYSNKKTIKTLMDYNFIEYDYEDWS